MEEKRDASLTKVIAYRAQNKPDEALDFCLSLLREMNLHIPRVPNRIHVLRKLLRARKLLGRLPKSSDGRWDILLWPESHDQSLEFTATLLSHTGTIAYLKGSSHLKLSMYAFLHNFQLALEQRTFFPDSTPYSFTLYGFVEFALGRTEVAYQCGQLALQMLERPRTDPCKSRALFVVAICLFRPRHLLSDAIEPCFRAYKAGIASGDVESAMFSLGIHIFCSIYSGNNLQDIDRHVRRHGLRLKNEFQQEQLFPWVSVFWQTVLNLMGKADDSPTRLTGEVAVEEECVELVRQSNNDTLLASFYLMKLDLALIFDTTVNSEKVVLDYCRIATGFKRIYFVTRLAGFSSALVHSDLFRNKKNHGNRRHLATVRKHLKEFRGWKSSGCVNEKYLCTVLEAEVAALSYCRRSNKKHSGGCLDCVIGKYDAGISAAKQAGFRRLEAQTTERLGLFLMEYGGRVEEGQTYIEKSLILYSNYGATAKVSHMQTKYKFLSARVKVPSYVSPRQQ